jgi:hypothetical protein
MDVESASAAYFGITVAPHEYFDQTGLLMNYLTKRGLLIVIYGQVDSPRRIPIVPAGSARIV